MGRFLRKTPNPAAPGFRFSAGRPPCTNRAAARFGSAKTRRLRRRCPPAAGRPAALPPAFPPAFPPTVPQTLPPNPPQTPPQPPSPPPPPPTFSMVIIYKIPPFYLFTFCRAGNAKTPFPCRSRQRKGVFMPGNRPGRAASQTKSSRMGVKMSSRMPASVQTQPCSTPSSFRMVSPARTVWVTPSTVNSKAPDTT